MDAITRDQIEQARHQFTVLGVYPNGHGIEPITVTADELHAKLAEIQRNGALAVIVGYEKIAPEAIAEVAEIAPIVSFERPLAPKREITVTIDLELYRADPVYREAMDIVLSDARKEHAPLPFDLVPGAP